MRDSIRALEGEGLLEVRDYGAIAQQYREVVTERTEFLLENIDIWRKPASTQWQVYLKLLEPLLDQYRGHCDVEIERLHFGVYCYLRSQSPKIRIEEGRKLNAFVQSKAKLRSNSERQLLRDLIRPLLQHAILNMLMREDLDAPFMDSDDLYVHYNSVGRLQIRPPKDPLLGQVPNLSREAFSVAIPDLRPAKIQDFIAFLKTDQARRSFREEMLRIAKAGKRPDEKWASALRDSAARALLTQEKRAKIIRWFLLPLKVLPIPGWVVIDEFAIRAAEIIGEKAIDRVAETINERPAKAFKWYYTLLELQHSTDAHWRKTEALA